MGLHLDRLSPDVQKQERIEHLQAVDTRPLTQVEQVQVFTYKDSFDFGGIAVLLTLLFSFAMFSYYLFQLKFKRKRERLEMYEELRWWLKWVRLNLQIFLYWLLVKMIILGYYLCHPHYTVFFF